MVEHRSLNDQTNGHPTQPRSNYCGIKTMNRELMLQSAITWGGGNECKYSCRAGLLAMLSSHRRIVCAVLSRTFALSSVKFPGLKLWLCKKDDKYQLWLLAVLCSQSSIEVAGSCGQFVWCCLKCTYQ